MEGFVASVLHEYCSNAHFLEWADADRLVLRSLFLPSWHYCGCCGFNLKDEAPSCHSISSVKCVSLIEETSQAPCTLCRTYLFSARVKECQHWVELTTFSQCLYLFLILAFILSYFALTKKSSSTYWEGSRFQIMDFSKCSTYHKLLLDLFSELLTHSVCW